MNTNRFIFKLPPVLPALSSASAKSWARRNMPWLTRRRLNLAVKFSFVGLLAWILYADLRAHNNLAEIWFRFLEHLHGANQWWLWTALALMPINWLLETLKWRRLIRRYDPISLPKALLAVLAGVSISLFTPNRIGEYGGRMLFVQAQHRWKAIIANLVGNYAQLIVLICAGMTGSVFCLQKVFGTQAVYWPVFLVTGALGVALLVLFYFNIDLFIPLARRIPGIRHIKRFVKDVVVLRQFSRRELSGVALLALLRYAVFSLQYFFLLRYFGVKIPVFEALAGISTLFLLQTSLPLPPVTGLVARGNFAIHIWTAYGAGAAASLAATFALFIINLILPSLIGVVALLRINIAQSFGYDNDETT